jgi:hypothetical protein
MRAFVENCTNKLSFSRQLAYIPALPYEFNEYAEQVSEKSK